MSDSITANADAMTDQQPTTNAANDANVGGDQETQRLRAELAKNTDILRRRSGKLNELESSVNSICGEFGFESLDDLRGALGQWGEARSEAEKRAAHYKKLEAQNQALSEQVQGYVKEKRQAVVDKTLYSVLDEANVKPGFKKMAEAYLRNQIELDEQHEVTTDLKGLVKSFKTEFPEAIGTNAHAGTGAHSGNVQSTQPGTITRAEFKTTKDIKVLNAVATGRLKVV